MLKRWYKYGIPTLILLLGLAAGGLWYCRQAGRPEVSIHEALQVLRSEEMKFLVLRKVISTVVLEQRDYNWFWGAREGVALAEVELFYGFDLSRISEQDLKRTAEGTLELTLPEPEVLSCAVDLGTLRIFTRQSALSFWRDQLLDSSLKQELQQRFARTAARRFRERGQLPERAELVARLNQWAGPRLAALGIPIHFN